MNQGLVLSICSSSGIIQKSLNTSYHIPRMKNINYDLIKMLHSKLDNVWRLEKYYVEDAEKAKCHSLDALKQILEDEKRHIGMLREELGLRMENKIFD